MAADARISGQALRWMMLGEWRARPGRVVLAALAIAVGVALGFAVHLVNLSALDEFGRAIRAVNGEADLQVHATGPLGFDEALYPRLARAPGVAAASPAVELTARVEGAGTASLTLLGLDSLRAAQATPSLLPGDLGGGVVEGQGPFDPEALRLSPAALKASGHKVGDTITLLAGGRSASFKIVGGLPGVGDSQRVGVIDIAAAQARFGQLGRLQRIDLRLAQGASHDQVAAEVGRLIPVDAEIVTARSEARRSDSLSRAYRVNLEMLAMVALLTGGFLVYSAQSLSVTRRRSQFALARVLGLTRRALLAQLFVEGGLVGLIGAGGGIVLGLGLADLALRLLGGDLGGGFFSSASRPPLAFAPGAAAVFMGLGLIVALAGSLLPAIEAGRAQPAVALKTAGDATDPRHKPSPWWGAGLLGAGALAALAPPVFDLPLFGYGAIALMLAGGVAAMPWLARAMLTPLRRIQNPPPAAALAINRLWGAPGQAAIALCGIVASTSLMVAMAVMVSSFRGSVEDWLVQVLPSDVYIRIQNAESGGLDREVQRALAVTPGVAKIGFRKTTLLRLSPDKPAVTLSATPVDRAHPGLTLPLLGASRTAPVGMTPVWLSEPMARIYDLHPGRTMSLPLNGGARTVFIAGVWRDYARQFGAIAIPEADYTRLTGDTRRTDAAIDLVPGASPQKVIMALRARLPAAEAAQVEFAQPREIRALALRIFDRSFAVTYALEAIAIIVGLTGVAATFSAQTLARTKEFGMLRHVGVLRGQVMAMLAIEGALLGLVGVAAGLSLGVAMSQVLIHVVNPQSFHWTMETKAPLGLFAGLTVALITASAGTAVLAGRSALSAGAVRAVREDW
jgi:putative ABC transport system permease protein